MTVLRVLTPLAAAAILAGCQRAETPKLDDALRNDLSLASQMQPYQPQLYVSPQEQGYGYGAPSGYYPQPQYAPGYPPQSYYPQPQRVIYRPAPQPQIRRAPAPVAQPASSSGAVYGSSGGVYGGEQAEVKNTKRDAIIGAAAGAAIGVASTRNTLKGAIIGAAAGGLLGAVVGEKIDVRRPR